MKKPVTLCFTMMLFCFCSRGQTLHANSPRMNEGKSKETAPAVAGVRTISDTAVINVTPIAAQFLRQGGHYSFTFAVTSQSGPVDKCGIVFYDPFFGPETLMTVSDGTQYYEQTLPGNAVPGEWVFTFAALKAGLDAGAPMQRSVIVLSDKPALSVQPFSQTIVAGDSITLSCTVSNAGYPVIDAAVSVRNPISGVTSFLTSDSAGACSYGYRSSASLAPGTYRFSLIAKKAGFGDSDSASALLTVNQLPSIDFHIDSMTTAPVDWRDGYGFVVEASSNGTPLPGAVISFVDSIQGGVPVLMTTGSDGRILYTDFVPDGTIDKDYAFVFHCTAPGFSDPAQQQGTITVRPKLYLAVDPAAQSVAVSDTFALSLHASARGLPVQGALIGIDDPINGANTVTTDTGGIARYSATAPGGTPAQDYRFIFLVQKSGYGDSDPDSATVSIRPDTLRDTVAPSLQLLSPVDGKRYIREQFVISLIATDEDSGIDSLSLRIKIDGKDFPDSSETPWVLTGGVRLDIPLASLRPGTHTLRAGVRDLAGNAASDSAAFEILASHGVMITSDRIVYDVTISPNPVTKTTQLTVGDATGLPNSVQIFNSIGARVMECPVQWNAAESGGSGPVSSGPIDLSPLRPGSYFLVLQLPGTPAIRRFTKF